MGRTPSDMPHDRLAPWWGRRASSYCEELRNHQVEFVETRRRTLWALAFVLVLGCLILTTGRVGMAMSFGGIPAVLLLIILGGNELLLRRMARRIENDCPEVPELRRF